MQGDLTQIIPQLRKTYKERELVNPEFSFIKEDYEYYNKLKDDISISLSEKTRKEESKKQEDRKIARKLKRESISEGELNPLITPVDVVFNSEDAIASEVDEPDEDDILVNTENNSEPDGDFMLKEAARIVTDILRINQLNLIAGSSKDNNSESENKL